MNTLLNELFMIRGIPHGYCFAWEPQLLWTMVISNALVAAAYVAIALALNQFIRLQPQVPYKWMFVLFSAFIFFCGLTHIISIINIWRPMYQLDGTVMSLTAAFSVITAGVLFPLVPKASRFLDEQKRQGAVLEAVNHQLRDTTATLERQNHQLEISEARFRQTFDGAPIGLAMVGLDGRFMEVNRALCIILEFPADQLLKMTFQDVTHPDDLQADLHHVQRLIDGKADSYRMEKRYIARGGRELIAMLDVTMLRDASGNPIMFISQIQDISLRSRTEAALRESELKGRTLGQLGEMLQACQKIDEIGAPLANACLALFPGCGGTLYVLNSSENWLRSEYTWGDDPISELVFAVEDCWALRRGQASLLSLNQKNVNRCEHISPDAIRDEQSLCLPMVAQGDMVGMLHLHFQSEAQGSQAASSRPLIETAEQVAGRVAVAVANLNLRESLLNQSIRDPLTNLYNRRHLEESMVRDMARALRDGTRLAVMMIDIDHFKKYNDNHGHAYGDLALKKVADILTAFCRDGDLACRYGGEEFAVVLTQIDEASALTRAESLRHQVASAKAALRMRALPSVTISIGVAIFPDHGTTFDEILAAADRALYNVKNEGRNSVRLARTTLKGES